MAEFSQKRQVAQQRAADARERAAQKKSTGRLQKALRSGGLSLPKIKGVSIATPRRSAGRGRAGPGGGRSPELLMKVHKGGLAADRYAARKGELLDTNMWALDSDRRAREWGLDQARHPRVKNLFCHVSLSRPAGRPLTEQQWNQVARTWLREVGAEGAPYVLYRHADTGNDHVHLIFSRALPNGALVSTSNNFYKWRAGVRQVERELGLAPPAEAEAQRQATSTRPASDRAVSAQRRAQRRGTVDPWIDPRQVHDVLASATTAQQLAQELGQRGIEVQVRRDPSGKATGLLLRRAGAEWLAGSSIDRQFSLTRVESRLAQNHAQQAAQAARQRGLRRSETPTHQLPRERG